MHKKLKRSALALACATALLSLATAPVGAAEWTGAQSNDWFDQNNWDTATVPGAADQVIVDLDTPNPIVRADLVGAQVDSLVVGDVGSGLLSIQDGGVLQSSGNDLIGRAAGSTGTVIVDGIDSVWSTGNLVVGDAGTGSLTIRNSGEVSGAGVVDLGREIGSLGTATVDNGVWTSTAGFKVGVEGTGSIAITGGGLVNGGSSSIGFDEGSTGTATVTGVGSRWGSTGTFTIGNIGNGTLTVSDSGAVDSTGVVNIGLFLGSEGEVNVTSDARLNTNQSVTVGNEGIGTLNVSDGGQVTTQFGLFLGVLGPSVGTATVDDASLTIGSTVIVGNSGKGDLTLRNGAVMTSGDGLIGAEIGGTGAVTVDGAGSNWNNGGFLSVGNQGTGALTISNGGAVNTADGAFIGGFAGASGGATIDGAGSTWSVGGFFDIGTNGTGALSLRNGGTLNTATTTAIGFQTGSSGTVIVDGAGSNWAGNLIQVGNHGTGALTIQNGGTVSNNFFGSIGDQADGRGTVTVDGVGSSWINVNDLRVGNFGSGDLFVRNGGVVSSNGGFIGGQAGSVSTATVEGAGSSWFVSGGLFSVGSAGSGTLTISNGGTVNSDTGVIGRFIDGTGTVIVESSGSSWTIGNLLNVGNLGNGTLLIRNGGLVSSTAGVIGFQQASIGSATVDGGSWINAGNFSVGDLSEGTLAITNGGTVSNTDGVIGSQAGATGTVTVSGAGSSWTSSDTLFVGNFGSGSLAVRNGGAVSSLFARIGSEAGATGTVVVEGAGSLWTNTTNNLIVGGGGNGSLTIRDGGAMTNAGNVFVGSDFGANGAVTVQGAGARWFNDGFLFIGDEGRGTFSILDGGSAISTGIGSTAAGSSIGREADAVGSVTVAGSGSTWVDSGILTVGDAGIGSLTLANGGSVSANGVSVAAATGSTGTLNIGAAAGEAAVGAGTLDSPTLAFGAGAGTLNFNHTDINYAFDAAISGAGSVNVFSGTTRLTAVNSYLGGTNVNGGTLLVDGTLTESSVSTASGATFGGSGTVIGDVTIVDGATLSPGSGVGTLSVGSLALNDGAILDYELGQANVVGGGVNDLVEVAGSLTLDGTLNVTDIGGFGTGVYRLMNYGGGLTDNGLEFGTLPAGLDTADLFLQTSVTGQINLINSAGATLSFWDGGNAALHDNSAINGGAGVWNADNRNWTQADGAINGRSNQDFAVFNSAAGTVTVEGEQGFTGLQFITDGYALAAGTGGALRTDTAQTVIRVDPNVTAQVAVPIIGNGGLVKTDSGTLILQGASGYTGGVTVDAGRLVGDTGNLLGSIVNRGELEFAQAVDGAVAGAISGTGTLTKSGAGTLTFNAANTYTGATAINEGTLRLGAGGSVVGNVAIDSDARFVFDRSDDLVFGGILSGGGALDKLGAGTLSLGGNSAAFSGVTSVNAGTLRLGGGALGGSTSIAAGARLSGNGTLNNLSVAGTVAPGDAIGTLNVGGNFLQSAGSRFEAQINAAGQSDLIAVGGSATLNGGTLAVIGEAAPVGTRYTLLTATGGVSGQYAALDATAAPTPFLQLVLNYAPNAVFLDVARSAVTFGSIGLTRNQRATGTGLDSLGDNGALIDAMVALDTPQAVAALDLLSGEIHASTHSALIDNSRFVRAAANDRLHHAFVAGDSAEGVGVWANLYDHGGDTDSDGNAARTRQHGDGLFVGADIPVGAGLRVGLMGGYGDSRFEADDRASIASTEDLHAGVYGGGQWGRFGIKLGAAHSQHRVDSVRNVAFAGFADTLSARYDAQATQLFAEAGYRFNLGRLGLKPYLSLAQVELKTDGFQERGGAAALSVADSKTRTGFGTLGVHWAMDGGDLAGAQWNVRGTLGWRHAFGDVLPESSHRFANGDAFAIAGVPLDEDALVADLSLGLQLSRTTSVEVAYSGQIGDDADDHGVKARVQWQF